MALLALVSLRQYAGALVRDGRSTVPICRAPLDELSEPPIPLRPLSRNEIINKLSAVPVFGIVNDENQLIATTEADGVDTCRLYIDIDDARKALAQLLSNNPKVAFTISIAPLGSAFAWSEWQERVAEDDFEGLGEGSTLVGADELYDAEAVQSADDVGVMATPAGTSVQLQATASEAAAVRKLTDAAPVPPLLRRRNARMGPIPLFGMEQLRFTHSAQGGSGSGRSMTPLFFRRDDLHAAWDASANGLSTRPTTYMTDLRTLAYQMQFDTTQDWRGLLLVAPETSIEYLSSFGQQQLAA